MKSETTSTKTLTLTLLDKYGWFNFKDLWLATPGKPLERDVTVAATLQEAFKAFKGVKVTPNTVRNFRYRLYDKEPAAFGELKSYEKGREKAVPASAPAATEGEGPKSGKDDVASALWAIHGVLKRIEKLMEPPHAVTKHSPPHEEAADVPGLFDTPPVVSTN